MELREMIYNNVKITLLVKYNDKYTDNTNIEYGYFLNGYEVIDLTNIKPIYLEIFELLKKHS